MSRFFAEFIAPLSAGQSRVVPARAFLQERKEVTDSGSEDLLSVSEYTGVTRRADSVEDGEYLSRAESLEGYRHVAPDDLVINYMLAWKGALGVSPLAGITSPAYAVFKINATKAHPRFVHALLRSGLFKAYFKTESTGIIESRLRLYPESLLSLRMVLPALEAQRAIAEYLDRETARIDALIEKKTRFIALLSERTETLVTNAVTRGLDGNGAVKQGPEWLPEVPIAWDVCQLRRTWATAEYGLSESIRDEGTVPVLRMSSVFDGRVDPTKAGSVPEVDDALLLRRNDLLFNRTNSLDQIAKVGLVDFDPDGPLSFASYLVRIRLNSRADPRYLTRLLNCRPFLEYARRHAIPAIGQANLSPSRYGELRIPLPPIQVQQAISRHLDAHLEEINPVRRAVQRSIDLLRERRSALITSAVTGQIDVRDASAEKEHSEPAGALA
jgi:type I restriction enzyme S subunit